jgi:hypothetical protein
MTDRSPYANDGDPESIVEEPRPIPAAEERARWRDQYLAADGLLVLLGAWLVVSPLFLDYGDGDATWDPIVSGALIVAASAGLVWRSRPAAAFTVAVVAVWLFVSAFWLADSSAATWNAIAGGGLAFFLAIAAAAAATRD